MAENKFSLIPDNAITDLSKNVYKDVGNPILKEVGDVGAAIMKFVALPFKFLGLTADELEKKYSVFLKKTINKVPQSECIIPKSVIAAPLLDHVKFIFDEESLSEMFSNLLANAMNTNIEKMVHPAFVEMLKQMSPLDAEFMQLYFNKYDLVEMSELTWKRGEQQKSLTIDSLTRLGIINAISYNDRDDVAFVLSDFGKVFRNLCMMSPSEINIHAQDEEYDESSDTGLMFYDSFATARKSSANGRIYVRETFQMQDVKNGSNIIILLRISNISDKNKVINSLYIECEEKKHIITDNPLPAKILAGKYMNFIFMATSENKLLDEVIREKTKYVIQIGTSICDFSITNGTKKEVKIFLENYMKDDNEDMRSN